MICCQWKVRLPWFHCMSYPLQLKEQIVIGPPVPPRLTHAPCTWTTAKAQLFPKAKEHSCCCDQECVSFHTLLSAFKVWEYFKNKAKLCIWHVCKSPLFFGYKYDKNFWHKIDDLLCKIWRFHWKNQDLFRFLNARICWCTDRACLAQSALFFLCSKWLSKSTVRDIAQVSVCKAQHFSSTDKGHELEPEQAPAHSRAPEPLEKGCSSLCPGTEQSPGTAGVG